MAYKTVNVAGGRKKKVRVHKKIHFYKPKTRSLQRNPRYAAKAVHQLKQEARAPKVRKRRRLVLCYNPRLLIVLRRRRTQPVLEATTAV